MGFRVRFMGLSNVAGAFSDFSGTIMYSAGHPERSSVSLVIKTQSISTNSTDRDRHLRTPDFFDVARYPYIIFRSSSIRRSSAGYIADGDFSMHGLTKRISLPFTMLNPPMLDAWRNSRVTFHATYGLSRKEFGILGTAFWNKEFDPGRLSVGDHIDLDLLVSAENSNPELWHDPFGDSLLTVIGKLGVPGAVAQLQTARAANPSLDSIQDFSLLMVGEKLRAHGRHAEAATMYDAFVAMKPTSTTLLRFSGEAYLSLGQLDKARDLFSKAAAIDSTNTAATEWLRVLSRVGKQKPLTGY